MIKNMESIGLTGCGLNDILECSGRKQGGEYLVCFLIIIGLMTRTLHIAVCRS